jgi:hypothetical protein
VSSENETKTVSQNVLYGLAMVGGLGLTLMIIAAAFGVVGAMDSSMVFTLVMLGAGLLIAAIAGWVIATRPFEHFDDITVPQYTGHHHEEHHEESHQEAAH